MKRRPEIILSLTDFATAIHKGKILILLCGLVFMSLTFFYLLLRPISFTSQGTFKNGTSQGTATFLDAFQLFGHNESYLPMDEPHKFLCSYPVLKQVVLNLNLQVAVSGNPTSAWYQEIWYTLKTATRLHQLKRKKPPSLILNSKVSVPDRPIVPDLPVEMSCQAVHFLSEVSQSFSIKWFDTTTYHVLFEGSCLGIGQRDLPFCWESGSFILSGVPVPGKIYGLHFIPLEQAVLSLQESLHIARDKKNSSLIHISYTHRNRHLAASLVNAVMEEFENYLKGEGKKKITKQLAYLRQRQDETMGLLEAILEKHKAYLEGHLDAGAIFSLEKELEFMTKRESDIKCEMLNIQTEIKSLAPSHLPFPQLVDQLRAQRNSHELERLSISGAKSLIQTHQHDLSLLYLTRERYDDCLNRLTDASFESLSLSNLLTDDSLRPRFEKIESLHRHLSDHQNWSVKEREQLLVELEGEKQFVAHRLIYLKEGTFLQERILKARITSLENHLLYLLLDSLAQVENSLATLSQQAAHLPQKWLDEQKIELHTKIYTEMIESITKIIEAKNIDYHLDYLLASSFKQALPPILPNSPHLFLGIFAGGGVGLGLALFTLTFYIIWRGPSASSTNLISQGYQVIPTKEQIARLGFALAECGSIILIASQTTRSFLPSLTKWFSKRGEKVFLIDFSSALLPPFMIGEERSAYLTSRRFQDLLINYKTSYDRILIISNAPLESFEIKLLSSHVDGIVCGITSERLSQVKALPEHTFFLMIDHPQPFPLTEIGPKLESLIKRMKSSSFASKPYVWKHFFAKRL